MSQPRDKSGHDPLSKLSKVFLFSTEKHTDSLTASFKVALFVFVAASISLVFYSIFTSQVPWLHCPECSSPPQTGPFTSVASNSSTTNISHIVFGIGGSARTWSTRKQYSQLWWRPNTTRGFVWLDEQPDRDGPWPETSPPYKLSSNWKNFKFSSSQSAVRIARVISDSFRVGLPDARWFVMGDDDTVFFTENLVSVLAGYDHNQMYYIGGNSESVEQDVMHSYTMAFGGGGFAISYPLAAELVRLMDGCLQRYHYFYGSDQRVWACVGELGVGLTLERGFHQLDIRGDPFGLLAAHPMAPLVSLHHLDYVKTLFPNRTQMDSMNTLIHAHHLDPARTMQQCFCYHRRRKWSVSISWGYAVQIYPTLLSAKELETPLQTFQTWRSYSNGPFTFNTRPMSPDPCLQPIVFYLDWMKEDGNRGTVTGYTKFVSDTDKKCDKGHYAHALAVEKIVVSAPRMDPAERAKVSRRQCCEINRTFKNGTMKIKIRSCRHRETITI